MATKQLTCLLVIIQLITETLNVWKSIVLSWCVMIGVGKKSLYAQSRALIPLISNVWRWVML